MRILLCCLLLMSSVGCILLGLISVQQSCSMAHGAEVNELRPGDLLQVTERGLLRVTPIEGQLAVTTEAVKVFHHGSWTNATREVIANIQGLTGNAVDTNDWRNLPNFSGYITNRNSAVRGFTDLAQIEANSPTPVTMHRTYLRTDFIPIPCAYCTNTHHWNAIEHYQQGEITFTNVVDHPAVYRSPNPAARRAMGLTMEQASVVHRGRMTPTPILPPLPP